MKRLTAVLVTIVLVILMLYPLGKLFERKSSVNKNHDFIAQKENFDILFLGTSHVINGIYPMELWQEYGMVSYNLGAHASPMPSSYWILRNALDHTTPKLVVLDCMMLDRDRLLPPKPNFLHQALDAFPISPTKIQGVWDITREGGEDENGVPLSPTKLRMELLWDFSIYHSRWSSIDRNDVRPLYSWEMGAESLVGIADPVDSDPYDEGINFDENCNGVLYAKKIIEECQNRGIRVMMMSMPAPAYEQRDYEVAAASAKICEEYNIPFWDPREDGLIDPVTDSFDENSHLNPSGARKTTKALGAFIRNHFDVPDRRGDSAYGKWNSYYDRYMLFKQNNLESYRELPLYLMQLYDDTLDVTIDVCDPGILKDEMTVRLLRNLGIELEKLNAGTTVVHVIPGEDPEYMKREETDPDTANAFSAKEDECKIRIVVKNRSNGEVFNTFEAE